MDKEKSQIQFFQSIKTKAMQPIQKIHNKLSRPPHVKLDKLQNIFIFSYLIKGRLSEFIKHNKENIYRKEEGTKISYFLPLFTEIYFLFVWGQPTKKQSTENQYIHPQRFVDLKIIEILCKIGFSLTLNFSLPIMTLDTRTASLSSPLSLQRTHFLWLNFLTK